MGKIEPQDMSLKFDGRVLKFDVYVNTPEDLNDLTMRLSKAARGQMRCAVVTMCQMFTGDEAKELWAALQGATTKAAADPKVQIVDAEGVRQIDDEIAAENKPPKDMAEILKGSLPPNIERMFPHFWESMISILVSQAIRKLPRDQKLEVARYLAEKVWPGSTRR